MASKVITSEHIHSMFSEVDPLFTSMLAKNEQSLKLLKKVILDLNNNKSKLSTKELTPNPENIFNAFRQCSYEKLCVVIIGQDPYPEAGVADGMAFSANPLKKHTGEIKIPASLQSIYRSLIHQKLIDNNQPLTPSLVGWAKQGVLLLNTALTTKIGTSNVHSDIWKPYIRHIISLISQEFSQLVFILWGKHAQELSSLIDQQKHKLLEWGHPSSLNPYNRDAASPKNFLFCTNFSDCNQYLLTTGRPAICWNPNPPIITQEMATADQPITMNQATNEVESSFCVETPAEQPELIYMATDGAAAANGKPNCRASYAFVAIKYSDQAHLDLVSYVIGQGSGLVEKENKITPTNNRGELLAVQKALQWLAGRQQPTEIKTKTQVKIIIDSEYTMKTVTEWIHKWDKKDEGKKKKVVTEKKNMDLIRPIADLLASLATNYEISFQHIYSHQPAPIIGVNGKTALDYLCWLLNDHVDKKADSIIR